MSTKHIGAWARESASSSPAAVASIAAKRSASASVIQTVDRIRKAIRTAICSSAHRSGSVTAAMVTWSPDDATFDDGASSWTENTKALRLAVLVLVQVLVPVLAQCYLSNSNVQAYKFLNKNLNSNMV